MHDLSPQDRDTEPMQHTIEHWVEEARKLKTAAKDKIPVGEDGSSEELPCFEDGIGLVKVGLEDSVTRIATISTTDSDGFPRATSLSMPSDRDVRFAAVAEARFFTSKGEVTQTIFTYNGDTPPRGKSMTRDEVYDEKSDEWHTAVVDEETMTQEDISTALAGIVGTSRRAIETVRVADS